MRTKKRTIYFMALEACAAMRQYFHCSPSDIGDLSGYSKRLTRWFVADMHEAWAKGAYEFDRPYGNNGHRWQLGRHSDGNGGFGWCGQSLTGGEMYSALHLARDMAENKKRFAK